MTGLLRLFGHLIDDAQIPFAQFVRRFRQFRVDDDDIGVGIVDHDPDRLHIDRGIDHRSEARVERITDDTAGPSIFASFSLAFWLSLAKFSPAD